MMLTEDDAVLIALHHFADCTKGKLPDAFRAPFLTALERRTKVHRQYRDDSHPTRRCDWCGEPYRGPAVYCSLSCALADA